MTTPAQANAATGIDLTLAVGPQLYRVLHQRIISGDLAPGTRISESEIAAQFGVSRQPVREAFIKLADDGLLEVRPQRGTFVRKISVAAVMDARFVREAIEADVVKLLALAPDVALVAGLRREIEAQREIAEGDPRQFVTLDDRFHKALAVAAGKPFGWTVIEGMKGQMDRVRQLTTARFPMQRLIGQHAEIVEGIACGDPARAEAAVRDHLREILNYLPAIRASLPEYFEDP